jgi:hypothetical protein
VRRRQLIALIGGAALTWPRVGRAQNATHRPIISVLTGQVSPAVIRRNVAAFTAGIQQLALAEGRDYDVV